MTVINSDNNFLCRYPLNVRAQIGPPYPHARRKRRLKWGSFSE